MQSTINTVLCAVADKIEEMDVLLKTNQGGLAANGDGSNSLKYDRLKLTQ